MRERRRRHTWFGQRDSFVKPLN